MIHEPSSAAPSEYVFNEAQEAWLKALESGEYRQCRKSMTHGGAYCCLAVACEVLNLPKDKHGDFIDANGTAPVAAIEAMRLRSDIGSFYFEAPIGQVSASSLAGANDDGATFSEIAAFIRSNPTAVFVE